MSRRMQTAPAPRGFLLHLAGAARLTLRNRNARSRLPPVTILLDFNGVDVDLGSTATSGSAPQPPAPDTGRSTAGWSYYGTAQFCLRKFAYENRWRQLGLPRPSRTAGGALAIGTFDHELLARYYLWRGHRKGTLIASMNGSPVPTEPPPNPVDMVWTDVWALARKSGVTPEYDRDTGKLLRSAEEVTADQFRRFRFYAAEHAHEDWEPLLVETELKVGILRAQDGTYRVVPPDTPGSVLYTSRVDLVVRDGQGKVWIVDHKTTSYIRKWIELTYGVSGQIHGFHHLGEAYFPGEFVGSKLNFFQTQERPAFRRKRPSAAPRMVQNHPRRVWQTAQVIAMFDRTATTIEDWPDAAHENICRTKYGMCPHHRRCRGLS